MTIFFEGILIGFLASIPIGPVSILIIQRTINRNRLTGFFSGIGAALSDTFYASIAGFSMVLVLNFIREHEFLFKTLGSAILLLLGFIILFSKPKKTEKEKTENSTYLKVIISTFLLTVSNPLIVFMHLAIFSGFQISLQIEKTAEAIFLLSGFLIGAVLWWFILTGLLTVFKKRFSLIFGIWLNRIAGSAIVIMVFVTYLIWFL